MRRSSSRCWSIWRRAQSWRRPALRHGSSSRPNSQRGGLEPWEAARTMRSTAPDAGQGRSGGAVPQQCLSHLARAIGDLIALALPTRAELVATLRCADSGSEEAGAPPSSGWGQPGAQVLVRRSGAILKRVDRARPDTVDVAARVVHLVGDRLGEPDDGDLRGAVRAGSAPPANVPREATLLIFPAPRSGMFGVTARSVTPIESEKTKCSSEAASSGNSSGRRLSERSGETLCAPTATKRRSAAWPTFPAEP